MNTVFMVSVHRKGRRKRREIKSVPNCYHGEAGDWEAGRLGGCVVAIHELPLPIQASFALSLRLLFCHCEPPLLSLRA